jgi:hypothetical protein
MINIRFCYSSLYDILSTAKKQAEKRLQTMYCVSGIRFRKLSAVFSALLPRAGHEPAGARV